MTVAAQLFYTVARYINLARQTHMAPPHTIPVGGTGATGEICWRNGVPILEAVVVCGSAAPCPHEIREVFVRHIEHVVEVLASKDYERMGEFAPLARIIMNKCPDRKAVLRGLVIVADAFYYAFNTAARDSWELRLLAEQWNNTLVLIRKHRPEDVMALFVNIAPQMDKAYKGAIERILAERKRMNETRFALNDIYNITLEHDAEWKKGLKASLGEEDIITDLNIAIGIAGNGAYE